MDKGILICFIVLLFFFLRAD